MIEEEIQDIASLVVKWRRKLHSIAEISFEEVKTSQFLRKELRAMGIKDIQYPIAKTGIVVCIRGSKKGKTIALRADMDALPISESNKMLSYRSRHEGVMHACGHDGHMAILLGTAYLLQKNRSRLRGTVKLIFQPAEERTPPNDGAYQMIKEGVLSSPKVDMILGLHLLPLIPCHRILAPKGMATKRLTNFSIELTGKEVHSSDPSIGVNSVVSSALLVSDLNERVLKGCSKSSSFVIGTIKGGTAMNIVPGQTKITGSFRTWDIKDDQKIITNLKKESKTTASRDNVKIKLEILGSMKSIINDPSIIDFFSPVISQITSDWTSKGILSSGSEDFSEYLQYVPGVFFGLGCKIPGKEIGCHTKEYQMNEDALLTGVRLLISCVYYFFETQK
jgi:amidohydrolase